jgi:type VI secretion system secreted protein Hcp
MAFDAFIKIPGVEGESIRQGHEKEIEIYSFSWGASNPTTVGHGTGLTAGKVSVSAFNFMKKTDKASPSLFTSCCSGKTYPTATVTLQKASGDAANPIKFLKYEFKNVLVESIQWSGSSGGDDTPTESVSLAFASVQIDYTPQGMPGEAANPVSGSWDISKVTTA